MLSSFLVGTIFACGYHFFYKSLVGKPASAAIYTIVGFEHSQQQLNLALGNALAFLSKTAFVSAVSVAYYQIIWRKFLRESRTPNPPTLSRLDDAFSTTSNAIGLLKPPMWLRYPLLVLLAATAS